MKAPIDILNGLLEMMVFDSICKKEPGAIVNRYCKGKDRSILQELRSEDLQNPIRYFICDDNKTFYKKELSKELMNFDKKFNYIKLLK